MDRQHLASWGCELGDGDFAAAVAALGVLGADGSRGLAPDELSARLLVIDATANDRLLAWRVPSLRRVGTGDGALGPAPASACARAWYEYLARRAEQAATGWIGGPRLWLSGDRRQPSRILAFARVLARPEVAAASVFVADVDADGHKEWRWPFTLAILAGDRMATPLAAAQRELPVTAPYRLATVDRTQGQVEVLFIAADVGSALAQLLSGGIRLRCCLLIVCGLGGESLASVQALLPALARRLSAAGLAILDSVPGGDECARQIDDLAIRLAAGEPVDVALHGAFRGRILSLLNRDFLAVGPRPSPRARGELTLRSLQSSAAASAGTRELRAEPADAGALAAMAVRSPEIEARVQDVRYVHQKSWRRSGGRFVEERCAYVVNEPVKLRVWIGPRRVGVEAAVSPFPDSQLSWNRARHRLQLVLHEPCQFAEPLLGELLLPHDGDSSQAEFVFAPKLAGDFRARLIVLHRGRVLQTVVLCADVVESTPHLPSARGRIRFEEESKLRGDWSDLGSRRRFDLAMVFNPALAGEPRLTGVAAQRAWATDLSGIEEPVREINDLISAVASKVADHGDGLDQGDNPSLLVQLARVGADLYSKLYLDQLQQLTAGGLDVGNEAVTHVQVVSTRSDALVPIEFFYDYRPPDDGARVCPQHQQALVEGRCPVSCEGRAEPAAHVCPLGFWGLKKVIERHFYSAAVGKPDGAELVVQAEPTSQRERLQLRQGVLLAHSQEVSDEDVEPLLRLLNDAVGGTVGVAKDWDEWRQQVLAGPGLLLVFPHNEGSKQNVRLEIGGSFLPTLRLPPDYVCAPGAGAPLVFLLGCDTAGTAEDYANHVRYFRQAGAAAVVSTIATVFGPHAVIVGEKIVKKLLTAEGGELLGEIMRDAKREALRESVPMALCVVAFGDADWRL